MASKVYFAPVQMKGDIRPSSSLMGKYLRILDEYPLKEMFEDKSVAIKIHVGGHYNFTNLHPMFAKFTVDKVRQAGGRPFLVDVKAEDMTTGYAPEVVGCPVFPAAGLHDRYHYKVEVELDNLKEIELAGFIHDADAMIVLSHAKGHGNCAYGGAIKNLGMGAVTGKSRGAIHATMDAQPYWDREKCVLCKVCQEVCRGRAIHFRDDGTLWIDFHNCVYCMRCVYACKTGAMQVNMHKYDVFQEALALAAAKVLETFEDKRLLFVNVALDITIMCDCLGFTSPPILPDIGIFVSDDIVAVEQATLDLMKEEEIIKKNIFPWKELSEGEHPLEKIWGKSPYVQVEAAERLGLGSREYELVEIE